MSGMPHRFRPIKNVNTFGPLLAVGDDAATEAELARSDLVSVPVFRLVGWLFVNIRTLSGFSA